MSGADHPVPGFKDHFSASAAGYSRFRPTYPEALFDWLATLPARTKTAWDCGCGNGQASRSLARRFARVVATDPSARQIERAESAPGVAYAVARAEASGLPAGSVDLILAAQAAHWFDHDAFHAEVRRVAAPGAAVALVCYGPPTADGALGETMAAIYDGPVGEFWPPERRHIDSAYRTLPFPFADRVAMPAPAMSADWTRDHLAGYYATWSAVKRCREESGRDPMPGIEARLAEVWPDADETRAIRWPLAALAAKL